MNDTGFAIIISNATIDGALLPHIIDERHKIVRAGQFERSRFDSMLKDAGYFTSFIVPLGSTPVEIKLENGARTEWVPPEEFGLCVVEYSGFNQYLQELRYAGCLITPKFKFAMDSSYRDDSLRDSASFVGMISYFQLQAMKEGNRKPVAVYEKKDLDSLSHYFKKILSEHVEGSRVYRALMLFSDTERLSQDSGLLTLSYFAVLESLVTNGRQDGDSITNQLKNKIRLLLNRIDGVDHKSHFRQIEFEALWKKLYGVRSDIAHGNPYDFTKAYSALNDIQCINGYLDQVVAAIIRLAIDEPSLVEDLRSC